MKVEYISFRTRESRASYIANRFEPLLQDKILDVGCFEKALQEKISPKADYFGIDIGGRPDLTVDLEKIKALPFEDRSFDTVVCTDVLEHIDNLHAIFQELIRVTKGHLILSLPNCWAGARQPIGRGRGDFSHYGLPLDRPVDRHKWFFSLSEARTFFENQAKRNPISIEEMWATEKPRPLFLRQLRSLRYPKQLSYLNRYAHTLWVLLKRT